MLDSSRFVNNETLYLYVFDHFNGFSENSYNEISSIVNYSKKEFDEELLNKLNYFEDREKTYNNNYLLKEEFPTLDDYLLLNYNSKYRYFICTLLAYFAFYNIEKENQKVLSLIILH